MKFERITLINNTIFPKIVHCKIRVKTDHTKGSYTLTIKVDFLHDFIGAN